VSGDAPQPEQKGSLGETSHLPSFLETTSWREYIPRALGGVVRGESAPQEVNERELKGGMFVNVFGMQSQLQMYLNAARRPPNKAANMKPPTPPPVQKMTKTPIKVTKVPEDPGPGSTKVPKTSIPKSTKKPKTEMPVPVDNCNLDFEPTKMPKNSKSKTPKNGSSEPTTEAAGKKRYLQSKGAKDSYSTSHPTITKDMGTKDTKVPKSGSPTRSLATAFPSSSLMPSQSGMPSTSTSPTQCEPTVEPSSSAQPSESAQPSSLPSLSSAPSESSQPSEAPCPTCFAFDERTWMESRDYALSLGCTLATPEDAQSDDLTLAFLTSVVDGSHFLWTSDVGVAVGYEDPNVVISTQSPTFEYGAVLRCCGGCPRQPSDPSGKKGGAGKKGSPTGGGYIGKKAGYGGNSTGFYYMGKKGGYGYSNSTTLGKKAVE